MNPVTSPRAQLLIGLGSILLAIGLIAAITVVRPEAGMSSPIPSMIAPHQQNVRLLSRAAFDAGVDKCLNTLRGQEPFDITTMIMESKGRFRDPSPQERGLSFADMKRHTKEWLHTPGVESVSVFVLTRGGSEDGMGARLTWTKNGGVISRVEEESSGAQAQDEP